MKNVMKRVGVFTLALVLVLGMMPVYTAPGARADQTAVTYLYYASEADAQAGKTTEGSISEYISVTSDTEGGNVTWNAGWYVVGSDATISGRITVNGDVHLILCDGKKLTAAKGITVADNDTDISNGSTNKLSIYGQTVGTGALDAGVEDDSNNGSRDAAIGGKYSPEGAENTNNCGTIIIHGGEITAEATSTKQSQGAGIGSGSGGAGGNITIYGGTVTATATATSDTGGATSYGAGIGGGNAGAGGNITIYGGTVTATATAGSKSGTAKSDGAGIGSGSGGAGGNVRIYGGTVTATATATSESGTATSQGAGIGGGDSGTGGNVGIYGGTVIATATANSGSGTATSQGAGIGGGKFRAGGTVTIGGGIINATGGDGVPDAGGAADCGGAGIGGGVNGNACENVTITGGVVTATGGKWAAGIGGGGGTDGGNVTITGGIVTANGGADAIGIGRGYGGPGQNGDLTAGPGVDVYAAVDSPITSVTGLIPLSKDPTTNKVTGDRQQYMKAVSPISPVSYVKKEWNDATHTVTSSTQTCFGYTPVTPGTGTEDVTWTAGWYVVNADATINGRITVNGDVHLILCDGAKLTAAKGITVADDDTNINNGSTNKLSIYGQTAGTGALDAGVDYDSTGGSWDSAIGGAYYENKRNCGTITIHGGTITATTDATKDSKGAGIGGSGGASSGGGAGGNITIYGGTVTATATAKSDTGSAYSYGAGIGGGDKGNGGIITIYGGTVNAYATAESGSGEIAESNGAGIGVGYNGSGGTISIHGGTVIAEAKAISKSSSCDTLSRGAGIGGGYDASFESITITGGDIYACSEAINEGDESKICAGCGIGNSCESSNGNITISGGTVVAKGGDTRRKFYSHFTHGIYGGTVTISGSDTVVTATGGNGIDSSDAGMNGGHGILATSEDGLKITGGSPKVTATGGDGAGVLYGAICPGGNGICGSVSVDSGVTATVYATGGVDKDNKYSKAISGAVAPGSLLVQKGASADGPWTTLTPEDYSNGINAQFARMGKKSQPPTLPDSGSFTDSKSISITAEDGATVYYTTDGSEPTTKSTKYTGSFTIRATTTIKAIAVKDGMLDSEVVSATYTYSGPSPKPSTAPKPTASPVPATARPVLPTSAPTTAPTIAPAPTAGPTVTTNPDGSVTTTTTETDAEGNKTTTIETVRTDGTIEKTTEIIKADGSTEKTTEVSRPDGSSQKTTEIVNADGSTEKTTESVKPNGASKKTIDIVYADGSTIHAEISITADGKETSKTVKNYANGNSVVTELIKQPSGDYTKVTLKTIVKKDEAGSITGATVTLDTEQKKGRTTQKASFVLLDIGKKSAKALSKQTGSDKKAVALTRATATVGGTASGSAASGSSRHADARAAQSASPKTGTVIIPKTVTADGEIYTVTVLKKGMLKDNKSKPKKLIFYASEITKVEKGAFNKLAKKATIKIKSNKKDYKRIKELIIKSGLPKGVTIKRM